MFNKVACIYSHDGFDLDVLLNQKDLLKQFKFSSIISDRIIKCDLLIVLRADLKTFPLEELTSETVSQVLFIDYSGQDIHKVFFQSLHPNKYLITSKQDLVGENIFFGFPYVSLERWIDNSQKSISEEQLNFVHIGNYKSNSKNDSLIEHFNNVILQTGAIVFGFGWEKIIPVKNYMGAIKVEDVSKIYSKSKFALGIKHPFQRGNAISGRYWHATLNGCFLLTEDSYLQDLIPGIKSISYDENFDLNFLLGQSHDKEIIKNQAFEFWQNSNKLQYEIVNRDIQEIKKNFFTVIDYLYLLAKAKLYLLLKDRKRIIISFFKRKSK